ncbi:MAG: bifunctional 4-hydroxy-2-oxoglutarate aldolase/2-dehydro-3-deoxy-phosphogluconate aldolase [Woeseiaceae bacterium]|nr:bifunctional 4-hydroxy-2-oxoglutarate aldolase/2-dehydro-3-deoxy-phosphogluconate aldolase [Woeseiaceae bacterium]
MNINEILAGTPVVPLVQATDPAVAVKTSAALAAGGLRVVEVVLRTEEALECLQAVADQLPDVIAGAGTVLSAAQAEAALANGAKFIVSPGLDDGVVMTARQHQTPVYPGIMTPGEAQRAFNHGLDVVKFFPASVAGGVPALKALASVFRTLRFMPTGGVSPGNLGDFLSIPAVLACGGSWLTPEDAINGGDYDKVTALAREAVNIAKQARGQNNG